MSKFLILLVLVTLKTMTKRGTVEIRTWMRTQDPRLAPSAELAAKDDGKIAFSPPAMRVAVKIPYKQRLGDDGALRRNTESRGPQQPVEAVHEEAPLPLLQRRVGRGTASSRSQEDAQFAPAVCHLHHPGVYTIDNHQTGMLDYTGEKYDPLPPGLPANLYKINIVKVKNLLANTRKVLPGGRSVAVLCALSGNTTTCSFTMRLAALRRVQQQHLSSPSAGTRPCSSAKSELKTQKEGDYVPDSTTDVRDSLEVEKKEQDESHGSSVIPPGRERVQQGKDWSSAQ